MVREVRSLWQILTQQAIGVFVAATLPGTVRMSEVDFDAGFFSQFRMLCHFAPLVISERATHVPIKALQDGAETFSSCLCGAVVELNKRDVKGCALDQCADLRTVTFTLDVVTLPMPRHQTFCNVGRTLINAGHVGNLSTPVAAACAWAGFAVTKAQQRNRVGVQFAPGHHVNCLINGFLTQPYGFV